jgi:3-hydroxybutyryl-CoA dehydrogenase
MSAPIALVGAGRMGRGLAVVFAYAGHDVALVDLKPRDDGQFERLAEEVRGERDRLLASLGGERQRART